YFLQTWEDGKVTLLSDSGLYLDTFNSLDEAMSAYTEWPARLLKADPNQGKTQTPEDSDHMAA
ncbi:MAG: hypothetical protein D6698_01070, partial [Gammaproteobacteria bacterium]